MGLFEFILAKNVEINKRPPLMTLLSPLGASWIKYGNNNSLAN